MRGLGSVLALSIVVGCSSSDYELAPVSGIVTLDGNPLSGVEVVFSPMGSREDGNPGPWSKGTTDVDGRFTLTTQNNKKGAVVGKHRVGISAGAVDEDAVIVEVDRAVDAANGNLSPEEVANVEAKAIAKSMDNAKRLPSKYDLNSTLEFAVEKGGTDAANFELSRD